METFTECGLSKMIFDFEVSKLLNFVLRLISENVLPKHTFLGLTVPKSMFLWRCSYKISPLILVRQMPKCSL